MRKVVMMIVGMVLTFGSHAAFLPEVGNGTEPNVWTSNMSGVLTAAKKTGYPIFLVMVNEYPSGEGCVHCQRFMSYTVKSSDFTEIVQKYKFYMVLLNYCADAVGYGAVSTSVFDQWWYTYCVSGNTNQIFPGVCVIRPNGVRYAYQFYPNCEANRCKWLANRLSELTVSETELTLGSVGSTVLSGNNCWTGTVTRAGGSEKTGTVKVELSGDNSNLYTAEPSSFSWGTDDGVKQFVVKGPSQTAGLISDSLTVKITSSGFSGSTVVFGQQSVNLTYRDPTVKQSLKEFADANSCFSNLVANTGTWYVPNNGGKLAVVATGSGAKLTWVTTQGGVLSLRGASSTNSFIVTLNKQTLSVTNEKKKVGVAAGDTVVISLGTGVKSGTFVLSDFSFTPLTVSLTSPTTDAVISWSELCADITKADLFWTANLPVTNYAAYVSLNGTSGFDMPFYQGSATNVNLIVEKALSTNDLAGTVFWGVSATYDDVDLGSAIANVWTYFSVSAKPQFEQDSISVTAYAKGGVKLNCSALDTSGSGDVKYSAVNLPAGLEINESTGVISGTPRKALSKAAEVTVTAKGEYGSSTMTVLLAVKKLAKPLVGNYVGLLYDANERLTGTLTWKIASSGKWTGKLVNGSTKKTLKGTICVYEDGRIGLLGSEMSLEGSAGGSWSGTWQKLSVYGKASSTAFADYAGVWQCGLAGGEDAISTPAGAFKAKVVAKGKVSITGKMNGTKKISGSGTLMLLSSDEIKQIFPSWTVNGNMAFVYSYKKSSGVAFEGWMALTSTTAKGSWTYNGTECALWGGSKWNRAAFSKLDGAQFSAFGGVEFAFPVVGTTKKISAGTNDMKAKLSAVSSTGVFKGSVVTDKGVFKFEGGLFLKDGIWYGLGGGSVNGDAVGVVQIVPAQ